MSTRTNSRGAGPWVAALLVLLLPVAYGAAYLLMLDPYAEEYEIAEFYGSFSILERPPIYRIRNPYVKQVLAPAHTVDRWWRPDCWEDI